MRKACEAAERSRLPDLKNEAYSDLSTCYRVQMHEYAPALAAAETALENSPPARYGFSLADVVECQLGLGSWEAALAMLDANQGRVGPRDREMLTELRARALHGMKRYGEALTCLQTLLVDPHQRWLREEAARWTEEAGRGDLARKW